MSGFFVLKEQGHYGDALLAAGVGELLRRLGGENAQVTVIDRGDAFELVVSPEGCVDPARATTGTWRLYPLVRIKADDHPGVAGVIDYAGEQQRLRMLREARPTSARGGRRTAAVAAVDPELADAAADREARASSDFRLLSPLRKLGKTVENGNDYLDALGALLGDAGALEKTRALTVALLDAIRKRRPVAFGKTTSAGQALNPEASKGVNREKPDRAKRDQVEAPLVREALKHAGLMQYALARHCGPDRDDARLVVPCPDEIPLSSLAEVTRRLRTDALWGSGVLLDIDLSLRYTEVLVEHARASQPALLTRRRRISRLVSGLWIASFKRLSQFASAPLDLSFLGLPGWIDVGAAGGPEAFLEALAEHRRNVRGLNEKRGDHVFLLLAYRRFLATGELRVLLEFLADYGTAVMSSYGSRRRLWPFTTQNLERILSGSETDMQFSEILKDDHFKSFAGAIRRATMGELYQKSRPGGGQIYEIRYGLGQEMRRRARRLPEFLGALSDFMASYNLENAKVREQRPDLPPYRRRANLTDQDLARVVEILERSGRDSEHVALLLVAYGFARVEREEAPDADATTPEQGKD